MANRLVLSVALAFVLALLSPLLARAAEHPPVDATWDVPTEIRDEALGLLFEEIAVLVEFDAFAGTVPPQLRQVHGAYDPFPNVGPEAGLAALNEIDAELQMVKIEMLAYNPPISEPTGQALEQMPPSWVSRLEDGDSRFISSIPYVAALGTLLSNGATTRLSRVEINAQVAALQPELEALVDTQRFAARLGASGDTGTNPFIPVMIVGAAAVMVGGTILMRTRGGRRRPHGNSDLTDSMRLLIGAGTEQEVAEIAVAQAVRQTGADSGVLFRPVAGGVRRAGTTQVVAHTCLARPAETGTAVISVVDADPALTSGPLAVAAVPVVTAGIVEGVLAVHRRSDQPFGPEARAELEQIAPTVAAALANVDRLGSMAQLALIDGLTQLGNRRRLDRDLDATVATAAAEGLPVAFAMIDVDHFKQFNDEHGHTAGDEALCAIARVIASSVRDGDIVYRYGGEEFSILLPQASAEEARGVAERVRSAVEARRIRGEHTQPGGKLTVSVGISTLASAGPDSIKERADGALYDAKQAGRNQVVLV